MCEKNSCVRKKIRVKKKKISEYGKKKEKKRKFEIGIVTTILLVRCVVLHMFAYPHEAMNLIVN